LANTLPPPPIQDKPGSFTWLEWYRLLRNYVATSGSIPWAIIDFAGSSISDIASRSHQQLQALQGGTTGEYYHLTAAQASALAASSAVQSVAVNTTLDDTYQTTVVTASGKTVTLPAASTARIGKTWTIEFATTGTCTVVTSGSDSFPAPTSATETTLIMTQRGQSVSFRCMSSTTWGLV
jgi:hypothetical protein